ncbi:MAG: hypothetical protein MI864_04890 [Pseudomonadales bacterium]|nr:hypothetical protein [Pseudomonadales bacterium]
MSKGFYHSTASAEQRQTAFSASNRALPAHRCTDMAGSNTACAHESHPPGNGEVHPVITALIRQRYDLEQQDHPEQQKTKSFLRGLSDLESLLQQHHSAFQFADQIKQYRFPQYLGWLELVRVEALGCSHLAGRTRNVGELIVQGLEHALMRHGDSQPAIWFRLPLAIRQAITEAQFQAAALPTPDSGLTLSEFGKWVNDQGRFIEKGVEMLSRINAQPDPGNLDNITYSRVSLDDPIFSDANGEVDKTNPLETGQTEPNLDDVQADIVQDDDNVRDESASTDAPDPVSTLPQSPEISRFPPRETANYPIFTTQFDQVLKASQLANAIDAPLSLAQFDQDLQQHSQTIAKLSKQLQRKIFALQRKNWQFDTDQGRLDTGRLSRLVTSPMATVPLKNESEGKFKDTVISLLIDNSGSMKGEAVKLAWLSTSIIVQALERCSVKTEVLGYTTTSQENNRAYLEWVNCGKPENPGRLNGVRHIIYKEAGETYRRIKRSLGTMLQESLLQENIDGEALWWAYQRILRNPTERRILIVISDGRPMDKATQQANGAHFLEAHLREMITLVEQDPRVELLAIGIGHDVGRYYAKSTRIANAQLLGETLLKQLASLFERE